MHHIAWAHAVSTDLVHWEHLPNALESDELGVPFSGSTVVDASDSSGFFDGRPGLVAVYTHHGEFEQDGIAWSADRGRTRTKYPGNPVIRTECPDFFELPVDGDPGRAKWVLVCSGRTYHLGAFDGSGRAR